MKILMVCSGQMYKEIFCAAGWVEALIAELCEKKYIDLHIMYPIYGQHETSTLQINNCTFHALPHHKNIYKKDNMAKRIMVDFLRESSPDVIHICGTEYPYCLEMVEAAKEIGCLHRVLVVIQGLCYKIAQHYFDTIPQIVKLRFTFRDILRLDNIYLQKCKMEQRGRNEIEALKLVENVAGRTDWDKCCVKFINPKLRYFHNNEILRAVFYQNRWNVDECKKYTIFVTQSSYTIKGFHILLDAIRLLKPKYPNLIVYTTGRQVNKSGIDIRKNSYSKYIKTKIREYHLEKQIQFCGYLTAEEMVQRYLEANVVVSPSLIENSSNSIAEAMLLGCPIVASLVGGTSNFIIHEKNGLLYQANAAYMLAYYIERIFENEEYATQLGYAANEMALKILCRDKNVNDLIQIYERIREL